MRSSCTATSHHAIPRKNACSHYTRHKSTSSSSTRIVSSSEEADFENSIVVGERITESGTNFDDCHHQMKSESRLLAFDSSSSNPICDPVSLSPISFLLPSNTLPSISQKPKVPSSSSLLPHPEPKPSQYYPVPIQVSRKQKKPPPNPPPKKFTINHIKPHHPTLRYNLMLQKSLIKRLLNQHGAHGQ